MHSLSICLLVLSSGWALVQCANLPSVSISAGTVHGTSCNTSDASAFLSIPYAQPPTGDLRFEPPQPYSKSYSGGSYDATTPAPNCIQFGSQFLAPGEASEDCLYLDVWVPPNANKTSGLPVKVWIFGGSNQAGTISDPLYDGCNLAAEDSIVVSINYRLGPLGYLALESAGIQGNFGIQDLIEGLRWIQSNIKAFGGDPDKVLLFGQSAGSINTFIISTLAEGPSLINAAVTESGGGRDTPLNDSAQDLGASFAKSLHCSVNDAACLKSKSVSELNASSPNADSISITGSGFGPYVDGKVIPEQPSKVGIRVPTIFGSNGMEGTLFVLLQFGDPRTVNPSDYDTFLSDNFGSAAPLVNETYPLTALNSTPFPAFYAISTVIADEQYLCSAYRGLNRAVEKHIPAYTYYFNHTPSCGWETGITQELVPLFGPTHTAEIPFVFGNVNDLPLPNGTCNFTNAEEKISTDLIAAWTSMAASGHPSPDGGLHWPAYTTSKSLGINVNNSTAAGPVDYSVCKFWDEINTLMSNSTSSSNSSSGGNGSTSSGGSGTTTTSPTPSSSTFSNGAGAFGSSIASSIVAGAVLLVGMLSAL